MLIAQNFEIAGKCKEIEKRDYTATKSQLWDWVSGEPSKATNFGGKI